MVHLIKILKMESLDDYILTHILNWLDDLKLFDVRLVCRRWYSICQSNEFWNFRIMRWYPPHKDISFNKPKNLYFNIQSLSSELSDNDIDRIASQGDLDMLTYLECLGYLPSFSYLDPDTFPKDKIIPLLEWGYVRGLINHKTYKLVIELKYPKALDWLEERNILPKPKYGRLISDVQTGDWLEARNCLPTDMVPGNAIWGYDVDLLEWCRVRNLNVNMNEYIDWYYTIPLPFIDIFGQMIMDEGIDDEYQYLKVISELALVNQETLKEIRKTILMIDWLTEHNVIQIPNIGHVDYEILGNILCSEELEPYLV